VTIGVGGGKMNVVGIRKTIQRRVKDSGGCLKVRRHMVFTELGLTGCNWSKLKEVIAELNEGSKIRVVEDGDYIIFIAAKERLFLHWRNGFTSLRYIFWVV
jgi:hypothetical protein